MKVPQKTSSWKSRSPLLLAVYLLLLITIAVPAHAVARCFGVPEAEEAGEEASWSMAIEVTSSNGFVDSATLGADPGATDGYDYQFDVVEPLFQFTPLAAVELTLYAYFYYPNNPQTAEGSVADPESTVGLTTSVIASKDNLTWPLQVSYHFDEDILIRMSWDPNDTRQLEGHTVDLFTPFGEVLSMGEVSNYSFSAGPGLYDFTIRALAQSELFSSEQLLIVAAVSGYVVAISLLLLLRRARKGRS